MRGMILVAIASILSSFASAQAPQKMPVKELIEKIKIVSPDGEANMLSLIHIFTRSTNVAGASSFSV